jgi:hypothetical protein
MESEKNLKFVVCAIALGVLVYMIYKTSHANHSQKILLRTNDTPDISFFNDSDVPIFVKYTTSTLVIFSGIVQPKTETNLGPNVCYQSPCDPNSGFNENQIIVSRYGCNEEGKSVVYVNKLLRGLSASLDNIDSCDLTIYVSSA